MDDNEEYACQGLSISNIVYQSLPSSIKTDVLEKNTSEVNVVSQRYFESFPASFPLRRNGLKVKPRLGTIDYGRSYEYLVASYFSIKCLLDENIKDFWILSNADGFENFDDLIIHVKYSDDKSHLFVVQCKQRGNRTYMSPNQFVDSHMYNKKMNLRIYEKGYSSLNERIKNREIKSLDGENILPDINENNVFYVLYMTMRLTPSEENLKEPTKPFVKLKKIPNSENVMLLNTENQGKVYKLNVFNADYRTDFLNKFYIFTEQLTVQTGHEVLKELLMNHLGNSRAQRIEEFVILLETYFERNMKSSQLLNKQQLQNDIFELFTQNYKIFLPHTNESTIYNDILQQILNDFDVVIFSEEMIRKGGFKRNYYKDYGLHLLNCSYVYDLEFISKLCTVLSQKCIIFTKRSLRIQEGYNLFSNIRNLPSSLIPKLKQIKLSFQEKDSIFLDKLTKYNSICDDLHFVTSDNFLQLTEQNLLSIGKKYDYSVHLPRRFKNTFIFPDIFGKKFNGNVFVILCDNIKKLKKNLDLKYVNEEFFYKRKSKSDLQRTIFRDKFIIPINETDWVDILEEIQILNNAKVSFHFIKFREDHDVFEWVYSTSSISTLRRFMYVLNSDSYLEERNVIHYYKSRMNIISCNAGAGKTNELKYLTSICSPNYWVVFLDLAEISNMVKEHSNFTNIKPLLHKLIDLPKNFEDFAKDLFSFMLERRQVIFFLDNYDEAYSEHIQQFVRDIYSLNNQVWIATRSTYKKELENEFNTFSIIMEDIDENFIINYIELKISNENFENNLKELINSHSEVIKNPFHLNVLIDLARESKFEINNVKSLDFYEKLYTTFLDIHDMTILPILALPLFFTEKIINELIINKDLIDSLKEKIISDFKSKKRYHYIITGFNQDYIPIFIHKTFAEYSIARYFISNCKRPIYQQFIKNHLFTTEATIIRIFFDKILAKNLPLHEAVIIRNIESVKRNLQYIEQTDTLGRTALHIAASYENNASNKDTTNENIFEIILNETEHDNLKKDFLDLDEFDYATHFRCFFNLEKYFRKYRRPRNIFLSNEEIPNCIFYSVINNLNHVLMNLKVDMLIGNIAKKNKSLLNIIVENCSVAVVKKFVKNEQTLFGNSKFINKLLLLHSACLRNIDDGNTSNIVTFLIEEGGDINKKIELNKFKEKAESNPLYNKITESSIKIITKIEKILQSCNLVVTNLCLGITPLHLASLNGHTDCVEMFLKANNELINVFDDFGSFPLHYTVLENHQNNINCIELLINYGAKVNAVNGCHETVLHWACYKGFPECVDILLKNGADVNSEDDDYLSPLHYACLNGNAECVKMLISNKAKLSGRDRNLRTPIECAEEKLHFNCVDILKEAIKSP